MRNQKKRLCWMARPLLRVCQRGNRKGDEGLALLMVICCSGLMVLLGLTLTSSANTDFSMSIESEAAEQAFYVADSGYGLAKQALRGADFTTLLSATSTTDQYLNFSVPTDATELGYFNRNPVPQLEALNIDFASPPARIGTRTVAGLLTPVTGTPVGTGRYFARVSDNDDGDSDPLADADNTIILRVTGIRSIGGVQRSPYGTGVQNAMRTIEATLIRDQAFSMGSPLTFLGPTSVGFFGGATFTMDGCPHDIDGNPVPGCPNPGSGISLLNDDPPNDAAAAETSLCTAAAAFAPQIGGSAGGCVSPASIKDDTADRRADPNPDAASILDANWLGDLVKGMAGSADTALASGVHNGVTLGTRANPEITYVDGAATFTGNGGGAGVLVINGPASFMGDFAFEGLVIITGGLVSGSVGSQDFIGGMITANVVENPPGSGNYTYGTTGVRVTGDMDFKWSSEALQLAHNSLPIKVTSWREILREIEPY